MTPFFLLAGSGLAAAVHAMTLKVSARSPQRTTGPERADGHAPARPPIRRERFPFSNPSSSLMDKRHD